MFDEYGSEVGDCRQANLEAGGWQAKYRVRCTCTHTLTHTPPEVRSKRPDGYSLGSTALTLWQLSFGKIDQFFLSASTYCGWKRVKEFMGEKKKKFTKQ